MRPGHLAAEVSLMLRTRAICASLCCLLLLAACVSAPKPEDMRTTAFDLAERELQTRIFDTDDEKLVLDSCSAVLQDLGFLIDESEQQLGLLVGSKMRSAINPAEVTVSFILAALSRTSPIYSERQLMRISLVTTPLSGERTGTSVRVTFQRIVYNNEGGVFKLETLGTPEIYQEFFDKLSKALFLEAEEL